MIYRNTATSNIAVADPDLGLKRGGLLALLVFVPFVPQNKAGGSSPRSITALRICFCINFTLLSQACDKKVTFKHHI